MKYQTKNIGFALLDLKPKTYLTNKTSRLRNISSKKIRLWINLMMNNFLECFSLEQKYMIAIQIQMKT